MPGDRFEQAIDAIDRANAADPNRLDRGGDAQPKELVHARMVSQWIEQLVPNATEALRLAARAHHLERWIIPRNTYPEGRTGYLDWRRALQDHHANRVREILSALDYEEPVLSRVEEILRKRNLRRDPEVQSFEDALCLVFLETQFGELAERLGDEKMVGVLGRTLPKMSRAGKRAALEIDLEPEHRALLERAVKTL